MTESMISVVFHAYFLPCSTVDVPTERHVWMTASVVVADEVCGEPAVVVVVVEFGFEYVAPGVVGGGFAVAAGYVEDVAGETRFGGFGVMFTRGWDWFGVEGGAEFEIAGHAVLVTICGGGESKGREEGEEADGGEMHG